ncbi:MAG: alpha/beta hydrolase [Saprospiraceae bacterium]
MKYFYFFTGFIIIGYLLGPRVTFDTPKLLDTEIETPILKLDDFIHNSESLISDLKPGNEAKIIWANDSLKNKTEYALVYLHGFSASHEEGAPIHTDFAKRYGMNLYLTRLEDHGRADPNSLKNLTPENFTQSAEDALDIAKKLGEKVIVMSCSTGGTLSLILAAAGEKIDALILYSPNIDIADPKSDLLMLPWGKQMAKIVLGGENYKIQYDEMGQKYWNPSYHYNSLFALKSLINTYMNEETFKKVTTPVFVGYYYLDEDHQDDVVSVERMKEMFDQLGTPPEAKHIQAFPESGHHVISSYIMSKDVTGLEDATFQWAESILGLMPIQDNR